MILCVDTDVLVHWVMDGASRHEPCRRFLDREIRENGNQLGIAPQVLHEFIHISTDPRRLENPLSMDQAITWSRSLWDGKDVVRLLPSAAVFHRTLELLKSLRLGRKRILDTALAATLEAADVKKLATLNARDFEVFSFVETVVPA